MNSIHIWVCLILSFHCESLVADESSQNEIKSLDSLNKTVTFLSYDSYEMRGKLVLPDLDSPRAIVIYVQTAEGMTLDVKRPLPGDKTFNYHDLYRKKFPEMGVGFFSYEGRGIQMGDEPPRYEKIDWNIYNTSTLKNKAQDVLSAIHTIRKIDGLEHTSILLMGSSEGTLVAAEAASIDPDQVSGLVLYAVMATNLRECFTFIMSEGDFMRFRPLDMDKNEIISKEEWEKYIKDYDFSQADLNKDGVFTVEDTKVGTKKYLDAIKSNDYKVLQDWARVSAALSVPENWFKDHFNHNDMWTYLSKLDFPIGHFHGDADRMTSIKALKKLESKAKAAKLSNMEFHYFDGLDHSLNIVLYFLKGELPEGHKAIFEFVDRVAPNPAE